MLKWSRACAGVAAGFNAPISGVFFAVESVLQKPGAKDEFGDLMDSSVAANSSGLTIAMVLLASVVAAVVSQVSSIHTEGVSGPNPVALVGCLELPHATRFHRRCLLTRDA